jgi:hypothetical protein
MIHVGRIPPKSSEFRGFVSIRAGDVSETIRKILAA